MFSTYCHDQGLDRPRLFMVLYLRYSGKKQLPDIPINLFYYCNLMIMIMNLFFSMCGTVALSSPVSRISDSESNVVSQQTPHIDCFLFSRTREWNTSYRVGKLVKEREKPSLAGEKSEMASSPTVFTILLFSAVNLKFHGQSRPSRTHVCLFSFKNADLSICLLRTDLCSLMRDKEIFFSILFSIF